MSSLTESVLQEIVVAILSRLKEQIPSAPFESRICYQSRVGRKKWLTPYTEAEIIQAGKDGVALIVVPVNFVSDILVCPA